MTLARLKDLVALPALIVGALLAVWGAFDWLRRIVGADGRLTVHIVAETVYHKQTDSAEKFYHGQSDGAIRGLRVLLLDMEKSQEAQLRGECLENPRNDLARQGLLLKCRQLGIDR